MHWDFSSNYSMFMAAVITVTSAVLSVFLWRGVDTATFGALSTEELVVNNLLVPLHFLVCLRFV